jgi:hypothetical protein
VRIRPFLSIDTETGDGQWHDAVPADADFVIVMPLSVPLLLADNLVGRCDACGQPIQRRPVVIPPGVPLVCMPCSVAWAAGLEAIQ